MNTNTIESVYSLSKLTNQMMKDSNVLSPNQVLTTLSILKATDLKTDQFFARYIVMLGWNTCK